MHSFKTRSAAIALALASGNLAGCAATGQFNGFSSDAMQSVVVWKNPDYGKLTKAEYDAVVRQAIFCKAQADRQLAPAAEAMGTMAIAQGAAGAVGVGGGASLAKVGALGPMAIYGAVAGGANGMVGGAAMYSANKSGLIGYCTTSNMQDAQSRIPGVHAAGSYTRTTNHSNGMPSWVVPANATTAAPSGGTSGDTTADDTVPPPPPSHP